eukprot:7640287-Pyramimonas_sp.AAC.1
MVTATYYLTLFEEIDQFAEKSSKYQDEVAEAAHGLDRYLRMDCEEFKENVPDVMSHLDKTFKRFGTWEVSYRPGVFH